MRRQRTRGTHLASARAPLPARSPAPPPCRRCSAARLSSYEAEFRPYLQAQIGNPDSPIKPNKKYYDPRMPLRRGEEFTAKRLGEAMSDLNSVNSCP